jgi:hypothetical protein
MGKALSKKCQDGDSDDTSLGLNKNNSLSCHPRSDLEVLPLLLSCILQLHLTMGKAL